MLEANQGQWFDRLYLEHCDRIYRFLRCRMDPTEAEDLTAQVFLEAWRQRDRVEVDPDVGWLPWLYRVARNMASKHHRSGGREVRVAEVPETAHGDHAQDIVDADQRARHWVAAQSALSRLSQTDRDLIQWAIVEDLSSTQVAAITGMNPATVRSRLMRARNRLRRMVQEAEDGA